MESCPCQFGAGGRMMLGSLVEWPWICKF